MARGRARQPSRPDPATEAREAGFAAAREHQVFGPLLRRVHLHDVGSSGVRATALARDGVLAVDARGALLYNRGAKVEACHWFWSISHVLSHLGFGHPDPTHRDGRGSYAPEWRAACCVVVDRFLEALEIPGTPRLPATLEGDEEQLASRFRRAGIPPALTTAAPSGRSPDLWEDLCEGRRRGPRSEGPEWGRIFALGLATVSGEADGTAGRLPTGTSRLALPRPPGPPGA